MHLSSTDVLALQDTTKRRTSAAASVGSNPLKNEDTKRKFSSKAASKATSKTTSKVNSKTNSKTNNKTKGQASQENPNVFADAVEQYLQNEVPVKVGSTNRVSQQLERSPNYSESANTTTRSLRQELEYNSAAFVTPSRESTSSPDCRPISDRPSSIEKTIQKRKLLEATRAFPPTPYGSRKKALKRVVDKEKNRLSPDNSKSRSKQLQKFSSTIRANESREPSAPTSRVINGRTIRYVPEKFAKKKRKNQSSCSRKFNFNFQVKKKKCISRCLTRQRNSNKCQKSMSNMKKRKDNLCKSRTIKKAVSSPSRKQCLRECIQKCKRKFQTRKEPQCRPKRNYCPPKPCKQRLRFRRQEKVCKKKKTRSAPKYKNCQVPKKRKRNLFPSCGCKTWCKRDKTDSKFKSTSSYKLNWKKRLISDSMGERAYSPKANCVDCLKKYREQRRNSAPASCKASTSCCFDECECQKCPRKHPHYMYLVKRALFDFHSGATEKEIVDFVKLKYCHKSEVPVSRFVAEIKKAILKMETLGYTKKNPISPSRYILSSRGRTMSLKAVSKSDFRSRRMERKAAKYNKRRKSSIKLH